MRASPVFKSFEIVSTLEYEVSHAGICIVLCCALEVEDWGLSLEVDHLCSLNAYARPQAGPRSLGAQDPKSSLLMSNGGTGPVTGFVCSGAVPRLCG